MKLTVNGIYNLGRAQKGAEKLFMSGQAILDAFRTGSYSKLANGQKAKLRKIANRLNRDNMWTQDWTSVPFHRYQNKLAHQVELDVQRNNQIYNIELPHRLKNVDVFIYAMAKVGGQTLKNTAERYGLRALHLHDLSRGMNKSILNMKHMNEDFQFSIEELRAIAQDRKEKLKIITAFRDPIAGLISLVFQVFYFLWFEEHEQNFASVKEAADYFLEHKVKGNMFIDWFDTELKAFTGINLLDYPFDKSKGYGVVKSDWFDLLVLRTDKMSQNADIIGSFLGINNLQLMNTNQAANKWYANHYTDFIKHYTPSVKDLDFFYNNAIIQHFFDQDEITKLKNQWTKKEGY